MKLDELNEFDVSPVSPERTFRDEASSLLSQDRDLLFGFSDNQSGTDALWREFWTLAREAGHAAVVKAIPSLPCWDYKRWWEDVPGVTLKYEEQELLQSLSSWHRWLCLLTVGGSWRPFSGTMLPGPIIPADGSRDADIAIDVEFHKEDLALLRDLGSVDAPTGGYSLLPFNRYRFLKRCREEYRKGGSLQQKRRTDKLNFATTRSSGPSDVLGRLSEQGKARYTWHLLALDDTYKRWTLRHDNPSYRSMEFESPALEALREHGRIKTDAGIQKLSAGLGSKPADPDVLRHLRQHPKARLIRHAFDLEPASDPTVEAIAQDDPIPLLDIWPGLKPHLTQEEANFQLIRSDDLKNETGRIDGTITDSTVYIAHRDDDREELRVVLRELGLQLSEEHAEEISLRRTPADIQTARDKIRDCCSDEERLLAAVGEANLRSRLPEGVVSALERIHGPLKGVQVAQAVIATFHTDSLREYSHYLDHLSPPKRWAGTARAIEFVRSLGFGEEWAGEGNIRREPYIEVEGPLSLPELHEFQREIVGNVRKLIRSGGVAGERRGLISMPTGAGKTRVAIQAIVEAIRYDGFKGGVLWVADRDELCEQAVKAWRQVWSSEGVKATQLRISRMWGGQPPPLPTAQMHVIVATIQTLSAKIERKSEPYKFLEDFTLLVFDEAHRSVAPTSTLVMQYLGLTRRRSAHDPILIGLTATPYRGRDEDETARLASRYGRNRLDSGVFANDDPEAVIRELQEKGILAVADHDTIEGGHFPLTEGELQQYEQTPWLPKRVEDRIAGDTERTLRIVDAYRQHVDADWPTLIFGMSVEHSQTIAALLTAQGVRAQAVSWNTDASSRRKIVDEFRQGQIKALVNFGIFREGFDAPKTRAIIVARPVYSPNYYFQMIGRGLRGTENGGDERCLILNVEDNIENFQRKLAFTDLDWLWA